MQYKNSSIFNCIVILIVMLFIQFIVPTTTNANTQNAEVSRHEAISDNQEGISNSSNDKQNVVISEVMSNNTESLLEVENIQNEVIETEAVIKEDYIQSEIKNSKQINEKESLEEDQKLDSSIYPSQEKVDNETNANKELESKEKEQTAEEDHFETESAQIKVTEDIGITLESIDNNAGVTTDEEISEPENATEGIEKTGINPIENVADVKERNPENDKEQEEVSESEISLAKASTAVSTQGISYPWEGVEADYFEVTTDNLTVYDNRGGSPLKPVGKLKKGQVYPIVSDYGNWWRVQIGDIYGYVKKSETVPGNATKIRNLNKSYSNTNHKYKANKNVTVYDNTSGKLVPFGVIDKGNEFPIATDYTNWWRIIFLDRVGYVRKSEGEPQYAQFKDHFKADKNLPIYDNRGDGPLKKVGEVEKGQVYERVSDYGNWHRIQFGNIYGYVHKFDTSPDNGSSIKNENKTHKPSNRDFKALKQVTVYDNTSGSLVPFGKLEKGTLFPIATDYGNWWRVILADRVGYVRKSEVQAAFKDGDQYFRVHKENLPVYDNRTSGPLKKVGSLEKDEVFPIVRDYGNWWRVQFGDIYGYVRKSDTGFATGREIKNLNINYYNSSKKFKTYQRVTVYDNTSGSLVPFGQLDKGTIFPIATDYGNWWRVIFSDRVGYIRKKEVKAEFFEGDRFFRNFKENKPIYDNRRGYLQKIGELEKDQVYTIVSNYGNWWRVQFGDIYGYVRKLGTGYATESEIKNLNRIYSNSNRKFIPKTDVTVYDNTSGSLIAMGNIETGTTFPIATDYGNWWRIIFLDRVGYVNKRDLIDFKEYNPEQLIIEYKNKDTSSIMKRIDRFMISPTNNYLTSANNMLNNKFRISSYGTFDFSDGIKWGGSPVEGEELSRSYYRALHGHFFINDLVAAYNDNRNIKYLHKGYEVIKDWITHNPFGNPAHQLAWHDEGTARRLITWINFYDAARNVLEYNQLKFLLEHMIEHADILLTDEFHTPNTNHGMFQDEALIVFSDYFSKLPKSQLYKEIGNNRLKDYFNFIISEEGVHLEHSPGYHQIIANSVKKYRDYYEQSNDKVSYDYFNNIYSLMANYFIWTIKPDGSLPLLGDTFRNVTPSTSLWSDNPYYQYVITGGKKGIKPPSHSIVFEDADYAIFRDDWEKGADATYIHFTAAYHTDYHKHSDDLSVWIYANGHDIVTEAGPNGYDYHLPFTEYAYSSYAHNTLIVNDKGLPRIDGKYDKVYLKDYSLTEDISKATGVNERFKDVIHQREVKYDRTVDQITITDTVTSEKENNYKLLWHLAEGVTPEITGNHIKLYIDSEEVMAMDINSTDQISVSIVKGQKKPYYLGWHLREQNVPVETYTIVIEANEANTEIETIFTIR